MKIGYPCINRTVTCQGNKTFRLKSYSEKRFITTVQNNLNCLQKILEYNWKHSILFFRISSDIIPFASHQVLTVDWQTYFKKDLKKIGEFIKKNNIRISMHPDQFIVLNSNKNDVVKRSIQELEYHAAFLDALKLDQSAKIQLHVGGVYGDKKASIHRFVNHFGLLSKEIKKRLVIENDERSYTVKNCLYINKKIGIPVLLDVFHHKINNNAESVQTVLKKTIKTWNKKDGLPMVDYSSQEQNEKKGKHADHIHISDFITFLNESQPINVDIMLEIKDKEKSALTAVSLAEKDSRFIITS